MLAVISVLCVRLLVIGAAVFATIVLFALMKSASDADDWFDGTNF